MKKALNAIEKILFYTYLFFLAFSLMLMFAAGYLNYNKDILSALNFMVFGLFNKVLVQNLIVILIIVLVVAFALLWIRAIILLKKSSFGPFSLIAFFLTFLFTNGYYNSVDEVGMDAKVLIITCGVLLFSLFYSMIVFLVNTSDAKELAKAEPKAEETPAEEPQPETEEPVVQEEPIEEQPEAEPQEETPAEPEQNEEAPAEEPAEEASEEESPAEEEPIEEQPEEEPETEEEPEETPIEEETQEEENTEEVQEEEPVTEEQTEETSAEEESTEEQPEEEPIEETPAQEETSEEESPAEEEPIEEQPEEETQEEAPAEPEQPEESQPEAEEPAEEPEEQSQEEQSEEEPQEEVPVEEAPAEEPQAENEEPAEEENPEAEEDSNENDSEEAENNTEATEIFRPMEEEPFERHIGEQMKDMKKIDQIEDNFKQDLLISNKFIKTAYSEIRNMLDDYGLKRKCGKKCEEFYAGSDLAIRISLFDRALRLYVNLDEAECKAKYGLINYNGNYGYSRTKYMFKVNNRKTLNLSKDLLNDVLSKFNVNENPDFIAFDFVKYLTENSKEKLVNMGYTGGFMKTCDPSATSVLSDEMARAALLHERSMKELNKNSIASITIGELSAAFKSTYVIDLPLLKEIGIVPKSTTYLRVVNGGRCTKALTIKANEFETRALKQILLTSGNPYQII